MAWPRRWSSCSVPTGRASIAVGPTAVSLSFRLLAALLQQSPSERAPRSTPRAWWLRAWAGAARRPARIDSFEDVSGDWAARARELGVRAVVGAPIMLEGRLWGVTIAAWRQEGTVPVADAERVLAGFTELVAAAIANAESREELASLADEQAALRRVATLVAEGARPEDVFASVSDEV